MAGVAPGFAEVVITKNVSFERSPNSKFKHYEDEVIAALKKVCSKFERLFGPIKNKVVVKVLIPDIFMKLEEKLRGGTIYGEVGEIIAADVGYSKRDKRYIIKIRTHEKISKKDYLLSCAHGLLHAAFAQEGKHGWLPSGLTRGVVVARKALPILPAGKRLASDYPYEGATELLAIKLLQSIEPNYIYPPSSYSHMVELMDYVRNKVGKEIFIESYKSGDFSLIVNTFCKKYGVDEKKFYAAINNIIPGAALLELKALVSD